MKLDGHRGVSHHTNTLQTQTFIFNLQTKWYRKKYLHNLQVTEQFYGK